MRVYTAAIRLANVLDVKHAAGRLRHLAHLQPAISSIEARAFELVLHLTAESVDAATRMALDLVKATAHQPFRVEVQSADDHDRCSGTDPL